MASVSRQSALYIVKTRQDIREFTPTTTTTTTSSSSSSSNILDNNYYVYLYL